MLSLGITDPGADIQTTAAAGGGSYLLFLLLTLDDGVLRPDIISQSTCVTDVFIVD